MNDLIEKHYKGEIEEKTCVVCSNSFLRLKKMSKQHRTPLGVRSINCVTCSKKCSREYNHWSSDKRTRRLGK